jgi:hypothetical protein
VHPAGYLVLIIVIKEMDFIKRNLQKAKQSHYRPGQALRVPGISGS